MGTNQPTWKLIAQLGDADPIAYGGSVYEDETGVYEPKAECVLEPTEDQDDDPAARWTVYRVLLDRCTDSAGVLSDNKFHPEFAAWFADSLDRIARTAGMVTAELRAGFCSESAIERAHAYRAIAEYHGWENLDGYPLQLTRAEVEKRYATVQSSEQV